VFLHLANSLSLLFLIGAMQVHALSAPPKPEKKPHTMTLHGDERLDNYFWLRERENPAVKAYLEAENAYSAEMLKDAKPHEAKLFNEFKSRIEKVDDSAPYFYRGYYYYDRTLADQNYPAFYRRKGSMQGTEELLLDVNELAKGQKFFETGDISVSPDDRYVSYAFDNQGRRFYTIQILDRKSKKAVLTIPRTTGNFEWAEDGKTVFYSRQDPETLRSFQVYRRAIGQKESVLVYEEKDTTFNVGVSKSTSGKLILIQSSSTMADEWRYLPSDKPATTPQVLQPRQRGLEYQIDDGIDRFYILTNHQAPNFQVMEVSKAKTTIDAWKSVLPADPKVFRSGMQVFRSHLAVRERSQGQDLLKLINRTNGKSETITFPEAVYLASPYVNPEYDTKEYLYNYQSLATPPSVFSFSLVDGKQTLIKRKDVPGGFDPNNYVTERIMVKARDGADVPMSLVYRKGLQKNGQNPTLVYGYGSYGITVEPRFSATRLSLLDRGFIYAIAHIRGGSMLGRPWYEDGKLLKKKNTFQDFIDCTEYLVAQKYSHPEMLYAQGGSAGGLLMGAVANMRPDLYNGMIAQVPFVDVMTTMLDESIPLTTGEYDEWGDPRRKEFYDYMRSYSPYDNVIAQKYPHLLVLTGFHDSQVQYWEPAKWVAKLREFNQSKNMILLRTNMDSGHGGASGRLDALQELAETWSFLLMLEEKRLAAKAS
jgi:oligopeptidase B